ncbi:MAG: UvrB/UvrC motif-containing protein [Candidatus Omnitrophota bacterium]
MKCDICGKADATVHLTEIIDGKVKKLHICGRCAKDKSEEMQSHFGLTDLLSSLMDFEPSMPESRIKKSASVKCDMCGMTYYDFQKTGRFGCGKCYEAFGKNLADLLKKIHGSDRHVGKVPFKGEKAYRNQEDLERMRKELGELVKKEEFEKAAVLRDRIRDLEDKLGRKNTTNETG